MDSSAPTQQNRVSLGASAGLAPLGEILCTERLARRPKRAPDYETENRALGALVQALADSPSAILQTLADTVLEVLKADSAGLSLLTEDGKNFYWPAIAGGWRPHVGGGTPRNFGPCGDVLDCGAPLLFTRWERRYPYLLEATPLAEEGLLVPFMVDGKAVGTIWAIAHTGGRQFDTEDLRQLESFGRFTAAAYQAVQMRRAEELHRATERLLKEEARLLTQIAEEKSRLAAIVEFSRDAIISKSLDGIVATWNPGAERLFGYSAAEMIGQPITRVIPPERATEEDVILERIANGDAIEHYETERLAKDGRRIPVSVTISPIKDAAGKIIGASKVARDISDRKAAEAKEKILVRELQHRSNNLLAVVQAIAQRSMSSTDSLPQARERFEARLQSLARVNRRLLGSGWSGIGIIEIMRSELEPFSARIKLNGPEVTLGPQQAQSFSLVIHELMTNAVKYGALSNATGVIAISWRVADAECGEVLKFHWEERGGPAVVPPSHHGFGTLLLKATFADMQLDFPPEGLSCSVDLALKKSALVEA